MIVLNITNAPAFLATKIGLLEKLTPDSLDQTLVEDVLVKRLIENLQQEGLRGEVAAVQGLDLAQGELILRNRCHVRSQQSF